MSIFPVKNYFLARKVLEVDFQIKNYPELYVDLTPARKIHKRENKDNYFEQLKKYLNINNEDKYDEEARELSVLNLNEGLYSKILFTGFRGSGKSTELYRMHEYFNHADRFFSVFIDLEQEMDMASFKYEDLFFVLLFKFSKVLSEHPQLKSKAYLVDEILDELLSDKEIIKLVQKVYGGSVEASTGGGINVLNLFKAKVDVKGEFATNTNIATQIRKRLRNNLINIIRKFNNALNLIRPTIIESGLGKDILFIVDSLEKIDFEVYRQLIVLNSYAIRELQVNLVISIPIGAQFLARDIAAKNIFYTVYLPVIQINKPENRKLLGQVIKKRIDFETFFENEEVLDYLIMKSGGVIRQLLKLTAYCLMNSSSGKLKLDEVKEDVKEYGRIEFYDALNDKQIEILKKLKEGKYDFRPANEQDNELLLNLFVLKYNSHYEINPVLEEWI